jgi:hypothetical protein
MNSAIVTAVLLTIAGIASVSVHAQPTADGKAANGPAGSGAGGGTSVSPQAGGTGTPISPPSGAGTPSTAQGNTGPGNTAKGTQHTHHRKAANATTPPTGDGGSTGTTPQ